MQGTELLRHLRSLTEELRYVFHGSPDLLEVIEPRQAFHDRGQPEFNQNAVYANCFYPIALLYAVIHEDRSRWGWTWVRNKEPEITVVAPKRMRGGPGYLYALEASAFAPYEHQINFIRRTPVIPVHTFKVEPTILENLQREREIVIELA